MTRPKRCSSLLLRTPWLGSRGPAEVRQAVRRQWICSLRFTAKGLGRPAELLPARLTALAPSMARLHHAQMGVTAKTLANHRANVRAAL
jgi:hypothetical protein